MAIALIQDYPGITLDQYDEINKAMEGSRGTLHHPGRLFHWVAAHEGGIRVVDVWKSHAEHAAFIRDVVWPLAEQLGLTAVPEVTSYEVHNVLGPGANTT